MTPSNIAENNRVKFVKEAIRTGKTEYPVIFQAQKQSKVFEILKSTTLETSDSPLTLFHTRNITSTPK